MQNKLRFTFFLLIVLLSKDIFSQNVIDGFVKDKSSNEFVPFSNVYMDGTSVGTITDSLGKFSLELPDSLVNSVLMVSNIGYESYSMLVEDAINTTQIIYLNKKDLDLPVFEKSAKKTRKLKTKTTGSKKKRNEGYYYFGYGAQTALYFHNDKNYRGFISKVKFYISDHGFPDTPFRVHVYSVDKRTGAPDKEILKTNTITSGVMGNEWVVVDFL